MVAPETRRAFGQLAHSGQRDWNVNRGRHKGILSYWHCDCKRAADNKSAIIKEYKARKLAKLWPKCARLLAGAQSNEEDTEKKKKHNKTETIFKLISPPYFHWLAFIIDDSRSGGSSRWSSSQKRAWRIVRLDFHGISMLADSTPLPRTAN